MDEAFWVILGFRLGIGINVLLLVDGNFSCGAYPKLWRDEHCFLLLTECCFLFGGG